ncbi:MAG: IPT/TIG domain-containing protein, partial [Bacteroidales bacterium]|nr:IPT/TIG domain-containing protein [Bacteroidales bacterium]
PDTFRLYGPDIKAVTPSSGPVGTDIKIRGKYLMCQSDYQTLVHIGSEEVWPLSVSDSVLSGKIPFGVSNGPNEVKVTTLNQSSVFNNDFIVTNPVISNIYPLTGTYDDEITIEGENFLFNGFTTYVIFNNTYTAIEAEIVELSYNRLVAKVPRGIDSIPLNISVSLGYVTTTYPQPFILNPPEITGISASALIPGQDISISGKNFNPSASDNLVFWGPYQIPVKSSTMTEIIATLPSGMTRGVNKISIKTAGYKRIYPVLYEVKSKWSEIALPSSFTWNSYNDLGRNGDSFSAGNIGYMMDAFDTQMTSYNPATGEFRDLGKHPQFGGSYMLTGIVCRDTLYLVHGSGGINRFDINGNTWINIIDNTPTELMHGVVLSINGKIYRGLNFTMYSQILDNKFWIFDPIQKNWLPKNDFTGYSSKLPVEYFVIGNKGYVIFADKVFCEYDPTSDKWTQLTSFPGPGTNRAFMVSFVIDNKAYVGLGRDFFTYEEVQYDNIWIFDPQTGSWAESTFMPWGPRYNSISFVVNNKAYIGFGFKSSTQQRDLFEFDPNYPLE